MAIHDIDSLISIYNYYHLLNSYDIFKSKMQMIIFLYHTYPNKVLTRPYTVTTKSSFLSVGHDFGTEKMDPL